MVSNKVRYTPTKANVYASRLDAIAATVSREESRPSKRIMDHHLSATVTELATFEYTVLAKLIACNSNDGCYLDFTLLNDLSLHDW